MTLSPARQDMSGARELPPAEPPRQGRPSGLFDGPRPNPMEWARRRRAEREARRVEAAGARALHQLDHLGPAWHVTELPRAETPEAQLLQLDRAPEDRKAFLAIGPSGLFAVSIVDHGRARVMVAGDVVQINGKRPTYVAEARRDARRATRVLSDAVGLNVPVAPVLTFVGSGVISVYGLPKECLVATHRELDRLLVAGGTRISAATAEKLFRVAQRPETWYPAGSRSADDYRWYQNGRSAADKRAARR